MDALSPLRKLLGKRALRRVRAAMRGYRRLRSADQIRRIAVLKEELTITPFGCVRGRTSRMVFGAGREQAELVVRQAVLARFVGRTLTEALLESVGSGRDVVHPLPPEWRTVVRRHGFPVAEGRSAVAWQLVAWLQCARGVRASFRILSASARAGSPGRARGSVVHFTSLTAGSLPQPGADGRSHDVMSWYLTWSGRRSPVDVLTHDVCGRANLSLHGIPVVSQPAVPPVTGGTVGRFIGWSMGAALLAAVDLVRGRWWHAMILADAAAAAARRMQSESLEGNDYLFHNSDWIHRPLWTYEAEKLGARILLYFYSTNIEGFRSKTPAALTFGWAATNWPRYIVWDEHQADFVRRAIGPAAPISIVGPVWFHTSAEEAPVVEGGTVAVFDVIPFRDSYYQMLGVEVEYYVPETSIGFLDDIQREAARAGLTMLWKRKRHMGSATHRRYRRFADELIGRPGVRVVNPDVSAVRLIENADLVISMAFTSTALIAQSLGKPTCFYDPRGIVRKDDPAARDIPVITGRDELSAWIAARGHPRS